MVIAPPSAMQKADDARHQRRLPRAVRTDEADHLARRDVEVDALEHGPHLPSGRYDLATRDADAAHCWSCRSPATISSIFALMKGVDGPLQVRLPASAERSSL